MTIANPIGYPTPNPMDNPTTHPNRPRIARIVSSRIESSPLKIGSPSHHDSTYVTREADSQPSVQSPDEMMQTFHPDPRMHRRAVERFEKYAIRSDGCWGWSSEVNHKGYARMWNGRQQVAAHRFSYELHVGPIPEGLEVGHLCHNRSCVNPEHLEAMTRHANLLMRFEREGAPCATLGRPMTGAERNARYRARKRAKAEAEAAANGWWVCI